MIWLVVLLFVGFVLGLVLDRWLTARQDEPEPGPGYVDDDPRTWARRPIR